MQIDSLIIPWDSLKYVHNWNNFDYELTSITYSNDVITILEVVNYCIIFFLLYLFLILTYSKISKLTTNKKEKQRGLSS
jgi:hypothetical protein